MDIIVWKHCLNEENIDQNRQVSQIIFSVIVQSLKKVLGYLMAVIESDPSPPCTLLMGVITMKLWHWKSHWKFLLHWKDMEITLKNIYKGDHSDNPGSSHWNIFLCCSRTLKSHWKILHHTEKFSALLISFVPRFFSITLYFQCDFQCHNFIVHVVNFLVGPLNIVWWG